MLLPLPFSFDIWGYLVSDVSACKNEDSLAEVSGMKIYNFKHMDEDDAEDLLIEIMGVDTLNEHIANFINEMQGNEDRTRKYIKLLLRAIF